MTNTVMRTLVFLAYKIFRSSTGFVLIGYVLNSKSIRFVPQQLFTAAVSVHVNKQHVLSFLSDANEPFL